MQAEHWIIIANSCHNLCFADSLSRLSFLKQQYDQMMPEPLHFHSSVCGFYAIYTAFHHFKLRQGEITGVNNVFVISFTSNYMNSFIHFIVKVQVIQCVCNFWYSPNKFKTFIKSFHISLSQNSIVKESD